MGRFTTGSTYTREGFRFIIAAWIVESNRPYSIVNDPRLQEAFQMLHGQVDIPGRTTVARDINALFKMAKANLIDKYKVHDGMFNEMLLR